MAVEFKKTVFALIPTQEFKTAVATYINNQKNTNLTAADIEAIELDTGGSHYKITQPDQTGT